MAVTRINNNQITDASAGNIYLGIDASTKLQNYSVTAGKIANNLVYGSDLTVSGNLTVNGTSTAIDTTITTIEDPVIVLASTQTGTPTVDIGFLGERGTANNIAFVWNEANSEFVTAFTSTSETNTTISILGYANIHTDNAKIGGNIAITGTTSLVGNIISDANVTGTITGANLLTAGLVSATGTITSGSNITGANLLTGGIVSATGTATAGNLATSGTVSATGTATVGNLATGGTISATGTITSAANVSAGNLTTGGQVSATGNIVTSEYFIGNGSQLTGVTASSANAETLTGTFLATNVLASSLTSVGNLTNLSVVGTTQSGNLQTAGLVSATGDVTGGNLATGGTVSATGNVTGGNVNTAQVYGASTLTLAAGTGNINLETVGNIVLANTIINGVAQPLLDQDAATKLYVDTVATTGLTFHEAVYATTNTTLATATGGTISYTQPNGVSNGIGAYIQTTGTFTTIDTANVQTVGTRILVKNEGNAVFNGVYTYSNSTAIVRSTDTDQYGSASAEEFSINDYFFTTNGNVNSGAAFVVDAPSGTITFGTSNISFAQFSSSQTYTANTAAGLLLINQQFNAKVDETTTAFDGLGNIVVKASAQLTTPNIGAATGTSLSTTGTITGGNLATGGTVSATATITGGNIDTGGTVSATGAITGGNINTAGNVSATGNVMGAYLIGNIVGSITSPGANTDVIFNDGGVANATSGLTFDKTTNTLTATGTITGGNLSTGGTASVTGTATVGNLATSGTVSATGNLTAGNVLTGGEVSATATITGGNLATGGTASASGNITGGNIATAGALQGGNIVISGDDITDTNGRVNFNTAGADVDFAVNGDTVANVFYVDAVTGTASFGSATQTVNAVVAFNATNSILAPVGNTAQRPATGVTGMVRFNTTNNSLELYDNSAWTSVGVPVFTVISDEQFSGDGSTVAFTLGSTQTTNSCIVSINGVVQIPTLAYAVAGTDPSCVLTFTEAPEPGDIIDVRQITTSVSVTSIANSPGNAVVAVSDSSNVVQITGQLSVSGGIIGLSSDAISNGTSSVSVIASGGNIRANVGGATVTNTYSSGLAVTGLISATGNIVGSGLVGAVFTNSILNTGANGVGNIGSSTGYFNTVFAQATSAQYADLAEKYVADAEYAPGTVVVFGGTHEVTVDATDADRKVAGVISTNPSYIMNGGLEADHVATVALTGRVPTLVVGTVRKGDLMVAAGLGRARAEADPKVGTVIGKALEDFDGAEGTIEVVVGRF